MVLSLKIEIEPSLASDLKFLGHIQLKRKCQTLIGQGRDHSKIGRVSGNLQNSGQLDRAWRVGVLF